MKQNKAYKFRLLPNKTQSNLIDRTIGCARFIYNQMLSDKIKHYKDTKLSLKNTPAQYKNEFEFLKEVDSLALANAQMNLETAYTNFFRKVKQGKKDLGFPKFKSKKKCNWSYTTNNQKESIRIENNKIKLPKIGFVKLIQHRGIANDCIIKSVTVSKTKTNKYYISILVEYETQIINKSIEKVIGLDFSMKELYVDSNGYSSNYPRFFRLAQEKLAKEQRIFSHRKVGSKRYEKQKLKVAKIHERITNQRKDFLHKESHKLANTYDMVCVEDLNMRAMSQCLNFGKSVADNGWGMFRTFLKYKLENQGKQLFVVDKWFPSSKMCNVCGVINKQLTLADREWTCDCGTFHNRDHNSAINLRNVGIKTTGTVGLAQECLCH
ncbi:MAG TPA: transposase [Candidatus Pacearchaeota archaeon]|nr:transposase [Candidatus Pacearchaeota archaeon]